MTLHPFKLVGACALSASLLAACGGGGGGGTETPPTPTTTPSTLSFALNAGYDARIAGGATDNFNLSGSCSGTAAIAIAAATPSTFEGVTGYAAGQVSTVNFSNCSPQTSSATGTTYYNASYVPIGLSVIGGEYSKFESAPTDLPSSVKLGDTATFATLTTYADSTKVVPTGKRVLSYVIEADTATTVILNLITRSYDLGNQLLATQQSRYRMAENGALTLTTIDVQFSTTSTIHLLYTRK